MSDDLISKQFLGRAKQLGIEGVEDLLLHLPVRYQDYRVPAPNIMAGMNTGKKTYLKVRMAAKPDINTSMKPPQVKLRFTDGVTTANAMVFGGAFIWKNINEGDYVHIVGKVEEYNGWPQIKSPEFIPLREQGRIVPVYKGKEKILTPQAVAENIAIALREFTMDSINKITQIVGASEGDIIKYAAPSFNSLRDLLRAVHRPKDVTELKEATNSVRRINAYQALLMTLGASKKTKNEDSVIDYDISMIKRLLSMIPFDLTADQKKAIWDITKDLNADSPMDRLLSGDVGCGKTLAYAVPAACAHLSGKNVVIMMPNTLLASQVAEEIKETFPGVAVELVIAGSSKKLGKLEGNPIIVGTSAILWWMKSLEEPHIIDFLIVDEQQKLGSKQKKNLIYPHTNVLEATATAIPRTAALVKYGSKKVSYIEECPVKKDILTTISGSDEKKTVFESLTEIVKKGNQIAILYPIRKKEFSYYDISIIDEFDTIELKEKILELGGSDVQFTEGTDEANSLYARFKANSPSAKRISLWVDEQSSLSIVDVEDPEEAEECKRNVEQAATNWNKIYPGRVVMIHGGLSTKDKIEAIKRAKSKDCDVIVTSSVIEIGLTIPRLRGLLVVDADKYGASTLHQLRGRLARHGGHGLCYLSVNTPVHLMDQKSNERLNLLVKYTKGSQIAEDDMRQRGFGDLSQDGIRQAGFIDGVFPGLKMNPYDIDYLLSALKSNNTSVGSTTVQINS